MFNGLKLLKLKEIHAPKPHGNFTNLVEAELSSPPPSLVRLGSFLLYSILILRNCWKMGNNFFYFCSFNR